MGVRERVRLVVDGERFQRVIIAVIIVNAIALGCETSPALTASHGGLFNALDHAALAIFVVELVARLYAHRLGFFRDPWNCFDFLVVCVSLLPVGGAISVIRSLRILRALRLVSMVPSMRRVVSALVTSIPGLVSLLALLVLLLYVGGVMASTLFGNSGDPRFGDLGSTILTLFQITTGDNWSDVMRDLMVSQPYAWIFFVCFLLIGTFTMLNLFIAVFCSAMESEIRSGGPEPVPAPRVENDALILSELKALREEVRTLTSNRPA